MHTAGVLCYRNEDTHGCLAHSMPAAAFRDAKFWGIPVAALQGNTFRILACTSQEGWKLIPSDGKPSEFCPLATPRLHFSTNSAVWWWLGHVTCPGGTPAHQLSRTFANAPRTAQLPGTTTTLPWCSVIAEAHWAAKTLTSLDLNGKEQWGRGKKHQGLKVDYVFNRHPRHLNGTYYFDSCIYLNLQTLCQVFKLGGVFQMRQALSTPARMLERAGEDTKFQLEDF